MVTDSGSFKYFSTTARYTAIINYILLFGFKFHSASVRVCARIACRSVRVGASSVRVVRFCVRVSAFLAIVIRNSCILSSFLNCTLLISPRSMSCNISSVVIIINSGLDVPHKPTPGHSCRIGAFNVRIHLASVNSEFTAK